MKLHQTVKLLRTIGFASEAIPNGTEGTIVEVYQGGGFYEVEFPLHGVHASEITTVILTENDIEPV
jgi:hypothetical protein